MKRNQYTDLLDKIENDNSYFAFNKVVYEVIDSVDKLGLSRIKSKHRNCRYVTHKYNVLCCQSCVGEIVTRVDRDRLEDYNIVSSSIFHIKICIASKTILFDIVHDKLGQKETMYKMSRLKELVSQTIDFMKVEKI